MLPLQGLWQSSWAPLAQEALLARGRGPKGWPRTKHAWGCPRTWRLGWVWRTGLVPPQSKHVPRHSNTLALRPLPRLTRPVGSTVLRPPALGTSWKRGWPQAQVQLGSARHWFLGSGSHQHLLAGHAWYS